MPTWNNVTYADGQDNPGGLSMQADAIKFIANDDLDPAEAVPDLPAAPTTDAEYVTVAGDFVPSATKGFVKIYCTPKTGMIESESVGEVDGYSFKHSFTFFIPGNNDDAEAFGRKLLNTRGYFVITELDGTVRLVGTKKFPAFVEEVKGTSGGKVEERRGNTFKVFCYGVTPKAPKFTGDAPLKP